MRSREYERMLEGIAEAAKADSPTYEQLDTARKGLRDLYTPLPMAAITDDFEIAKSKLREELGLKRPNYREEWGKHLEKLDWALRDSNDEQAMEEAHHIVKTLDDDITDALARGVVKLKLF